MPLAVCRHFGVLLLQDLPEGVLARNKDYM